MCIINTKSTKEILRDFAKIVNSDRYQYTESEIFVNNHMEHSVGVFDFYFTLF